MNLFFKNTKLFCIVISLMGIMSCGDKVVIPFEYEAANDFSEGLAAVTIKGEGWGYIDKKGEIVIPFQYTDAGDFHNGFAVVAIGDHSSPKYGVIDKNGNVIIPFEYMGIGDCGEGVFSVTVGSFQKRYFNEKGQPLLDNSEKIGTLGSDRFYYANQFREGLGVVARDTWGVIDKNGRVIIPFMYKDAKWGFSEGVLGVKSLENGKWGAIDKNNKTVVPFNYDYIGDFHEGLAHISNKDHQELQGFVDKKGKIIIPCMYEEVFDFSDGLAAVQKGGKWGFINKKGDVVIPFEYDKAYSFYEGYAAVSQKGKLGFINKQGDVIISHSYSDVPVGQKPWKCSEGMVRVEKDNKCGFIGL